MITALIWIYVIVGIFVFLGSTMWFVNDAQGDPLLASVGLVISLVAATMWPFLVVMLPLLGLVYGIGWLLTMKDRRF